jgi:glycosyltransferase involved in cell wall biosynthesis
MDVARALHRAAVFVTAPRATWKWNEQFGLAYVEAMSSGLPVVTTVCGTNDEAVQPPNLRTSNSADALAEGLLTFLADPALGRRVGEHNRAHVLARHDLTIQTGRIDAAFTSVERLA